MRTNYDKVPKVEVPGGAGRCVRGWDAVGRRLQDAISARHAPRTVITVECYTGIHVDEVARALTAVFDAPVVLRSAEAFLPEEDIDALVEPFNGGDDPVFGRMNALRMEEFLDDGKRAAMATQIGVR